MGYFSRLCVGVIARAVTSRFKLQTEQHQVAQAYCKSVDFRNSFLFSRSSVPSMSPSTSYTGDQSSAFILSSSLEPCYCCTVPFVKLGFPGTSTSVLIFVSGQKFAQNASDARQPPNTR